MAVAASTPVTSARVVAWTWRQARRLERRLPLDGMDSLAAIGASPAATVRHRTTVSGTLRLAGASCLVRSAVLQRWDADHDRPRSLVIGVAKNGEDGFAAHAWLEGDRRGNQFVELHRRPPGA